MLLGCIDLPQGYPSSPKAFKNDCLLIHLILGHFQNEFFHYNNPTFKKLCLLLDGTKKQKNMYGDLLYKLVETAIYTHNLPQRGPYTFEAVVPKLAQFYETQVHLIKGIQEKAAVITSFPPTFDDTLPQIYLLKTSDEHVILIKNKKTFVNNNRTFCFECKKTFSRRNRHNCANRATCFNCLCFFSTEDTKNYNNTDLLFCDSQIEAKILSEPFNCEKCELTFFSNKCFRLHISLCGKTGDGRRGWKCHKCNTFFRAGKKTSLQLKTEHICNYSKYCSYCFKTHSDRNHFCQITKESPNKIWPNLIFFAFQYSSISSANCEDCFQKRNNFALSYGLSWKEMLLHSNYSTTLCDTHSSRTDCQNPNVCVILKERERGKFEQFIFCDDDLISDLQILGTDQTKCILDFQYFSKDIEQPIVNERRDGVYANTPRMTENFENQLEKLKEKKMKTMLEKFVILVSQNSWRNSVFISHNGDISHNVS